MNGRLVIVLCILLVSLTFSCIPVTEVIIEEPVNVLPVAYIDSISSNRIFRGETITVQGHGTDTDGTVVAYEWRSSLDGIISTEASFSTSSLSDGKNTIYFRVQDNLGEWSKDVYRDITVIPPGAVEPIINSFAIVPEEIPVGDSATISWDVSGADVVSIGPDIGDVAKEGSRAVSPGEDTRYTITATNPAGSVSLVKKLTVLQKQVRTLELFSIPGEDGSVLYNETIEPDPKAGTIKLGVSSQAFLSFDISAIPVGARITSASIDISSAALFGEPFGGKLGRLGIFHDQYATLDKGDFVYGFSEAMVATYSMPFDALTDRRIINAVQEEVDSGSSRFQIRIQFEKNYYYDLYVDEANYLDFTQGEPLPRLIVKYTE
jgi:hypothetical protein